LARKKSNPMKIALYDRGLFHKKEREKTKRGINSKSNSARHIDWATRKGMRGGGGVACP